MELEKDTNNGKAIWGGDNFDIVGYCDSYKIPERNGIDINKIANYEYDYILITSNKYFEEIKDSLIHLLGDGVIPKLVSIYDLIGDFRNGEKREKWVIEKLSEIPKGAVLLDAGAGEQIYKPFCSHLKYISQDFGKYVPNEMQNGLQSETWDYTGLNLVCDIVDIPLEDNSIDVILCTEVFEHLKNPILALKEFSRLLRVNGQLILTAPFCCLTHMAPYFYYNGFSEYWYKENLADYGFEIREFKKNGNYFKYMCQELLRVPSVVERYCNIKLDNKECNIITSSIEMMMRLSERDTGSDDILRFGSMLVAEKMK